MDIFEKSYIETIAGFENELKSMKFQLAQLNVLSDSIKSLQTKELHNLPCDSILSSICTKWMQFNRGIEMLEDLNTTSNNNEMLNTSNDTTNSMILYSMLDEFELNDSPKPPVLNINVQREKGYLSIGFVSHIVDQVRGMVYILDVVNIPDESTLFGPTLKPLTRTPQPGEMFGYLFQCKYLLRAVRSKYEYREMKQNNFDQYTAHLIDIGCDVRIDNDLSFLNLYEVTNVAKSAPSYAKLASVIDISSNRNIFDLLHTRVKYKVRGKVLCHDDDYLAIDILSEGVNPFDEKNQKEWNLFKHFLVQNVDHTVVKRNRNHNRNQNVAPQAEPTPLTPIKQSILVPQNTNPFADTELYGIKSIPIIPLTNKTNPFYLDDTPTEPSKPKGVNFQVTRILYKVPNKANIDVEQSNAKIPLNIPLTTIEKQLNTKPYITPSEKNLIAHETDFIPKFSKFDCQNERRFNEIEQRPVNQRHDIERKSVDEGYYDQKSLMESVIKSVADSAIEIDNSMNVNKIMSPVMTETVETIQSVDLQQEKSTQLVAPTNQRIDFVEQKNPPSIGDKFTILYQHMVNVTEFYAGIRNDPTREGLEVEDFTIFFNADSDQFLQIEKPKLFDKVVATYDGFYYRAKVIGVVDQYAYKVFFVDYGNCSIVTSMEMFIYDAERWDEFPPYSLHFRLNRALEINPLDYKAKWAIENIMNADCTATLVDIEYCEKLNRTTYIVDLEDENGLNVAETLFHKNYIRLSDEPALRSQSATLKDA